MNLIPKCDRKRPLMWLRHWVFGLAHITDGLVVLLSAGWLQSSLGLQAARMIARARREEVSDE